VDSTDYGRDVLAGDWRRKKTIPTVPADLGLVAEEAGTGFCGEIVVSGKDSVTLEDRKGLRRPGRVHDRWPARHPRPA
jgi:hypothetical protein